MKSVGIICEYNPFHNGHIYHINKVREMFPGYATILVLSGNYTQRGDVSLINKWKKCECALEYVDLVTELPFVFSCQSADKFAKGSIDILKALKVDAVVFGSEENDIEKLKLLASFQEYPEYNEKVNYYLKNGNNYPTSMSKALIDICGMSVSTPNDLLGLSYVRELRGTNILPISIKRTNNYLNKEISGKVTSGVSIREALKNGKDVKNFVPDISYSFLNDVHFIDDYFDLLKYKIISEDISKYLSVDEGIQNRIKRVISDSYSFDELIMKVKSKRYTYNRLSRMFIHILTGFTKEEALKYNKTSYVRILGFNDKGKKYLSMIKKECDLPIITKFDKNNELLRIESRVTDIYNIKEKDGVIPEYKHKPIIR